MQPNTLMIIRQVAYGTPGPPILVRIEVGDGDERCEIDLAVDYRALPAEPSGYGPTLAVEELRQRSLDRATNTLLTL